MAENNQPFARVQFYLIIGISVQDVSKCCIYVDNVLPSSDILHPPRDSGYVVYSIFTFNAPRKVPFAAIISNLRDHGILPVSGRFNPPVNPDNKYYTDLPMSEYSRIFDIILKTLDGITVPNRDHTLYLYTLIPQERIRKAIEEEESYKISIGSSALAMILEGDKMDSASIQQLCAVRMSDASAHAYSVPNSETDERPNHDIINPRNSHDVIRMHSTINIHGSVIDHRATVGYNRGHEHKNNRPRRDRANNVGRTSTRKSLRVQSPDNL